MYASLCSLSSDGVPIIFPLIKKFLHLSDQAKVGEWYQNYTEIRVYGLEFTPYKFPIFVLVRIFALEYSRKILNLDEVHFVSYNKKDKFKLKARMEP